MFLKQVWWMSNEVAFFLFFSIFLCLIILQVLFCSPVTQILINLGYVKQYRNFWVIRSLVTTLWSSDVQHDQHAGWYLWISTFSQIQNGNFWLFIIFIEEYCCYYMPAVFRKKKKKKKWGKEGGDTSLISRQK